MLNEIEKKQLQRYETMMTLPVWKYVLLYGVLGWGITVAVLFTVINYLFFHKPFSDIGINLVVFPLAGILYGLYMRGYIQRQVRRLKAKENQNGS